MKIPELLAPAGNFTALKAAIASGADAIYMGGKLFNARAFADNFSDEELQEAVEYAHFHQVKIYITLNTLLANEEMIAALSYVENLYQLGVDGVIVQDFGLLTCIRRYFPALPVLASTQMTICNPPGLSLLSNMGIKRVILPRETSLSELPSFLAAGDASVEIFMHGALCVCFSGQCLMSSMIGGRSGNRGRCAQPCRMEYTLYDENDKLLSTMEDGSYLLSPRDLCGYPILDKIVRSGVNSLKLEGRMKRSEYVSIVTDIYRRALDHIAKGQDFYNQQDEKDLRQIFNRGFTTGYLQKDPGLDLMSQKRPNNRGVLLGRVEKVFPQKKRMLIRLQERLALGDGLTVWVTKGGRDGFTVKEIMQENQYLENAQAGETVMINMDGSAHTGDRVFKTYDAVLMAKAQTLSEQNKEKKIDFSVYARINQPLRIEAKVDGIEKQVVVSNYFVEKAQKSFTAMETIKEKLNRLGGSGFIIGEIDINADADVLLPASVLNEMRRKLVEQCKQAILAPYQYPVLPKQKFNFKQDGNKKKESLLQLSIQTANWQTAKQVAELADILYIDGEQFAREEKWTDDNLKALVEQYSCQVVGALPRIWQTTEEKGLRKKLQLWHDIPLSGILCGNLGSVELAKQEDWLGRIYGDFGLNVFNDASIYALADCGCKSVALSLELTLEQMRKMNGMIQKEVLVHGAAPLMVSRHCIAGSVLGGKSEHQSCVKPCQKNRYYLKDRKGVDFPFLLDNHCRMHIFNSREHCLISDLKQIKNAGITTVRLDLRLHSDWEAARIAAYYREAIDAVNREINIDLTAFTEKLQKCSKNGFTKGHFYRGVMEGEHN